MAQELNQEEVLIARNNDTGQVGAVTGLNEDGTPKMTDVKSAKLSDLVKFQKGQNPIEAFLSNFVRQCQNPRHSDSSVSPLTVTTPSAQ